MGLEAMLDKAREFLAGERGRRLALLLGAVGVVLLLLSSRGAGTGKQESPPVQESAAFSAADYSRDLEEEIARMVQAITGERSPTVLVTLEGGSRTVYEEDRRSSQTGEERSEDESSHVLLKDSQGGQQALIAQELEPKIKGVVVVSAKGGDAACREQITLAVTTALHLSSSRVFVTAGA